MSTNNQREKQKIGVALRVRNGRGLWSNLFKPPKLEDHATAAVWQFLLQQIESAARLAEFCSERRCRIRRFRQLLLFYHTHVVLYLEKALEDRNWSEDVSILAREYMIQLAAVCYSSHSLLRLIRGNWTSSSSTCKNTPTLRMIAQQGSGVRRHVFRLPGNPPRDGRYR